MIKDLMKASLEELSASPASGLVGSREVSLLASELLEVWPERSPLLLLKDVAHVTDAFSRKIERRERLRRLGKYTYYARGFDQEQIDDYTLDKPCLLVACLGTVETLRHRLVVVPCRAKGMPSELFHAVIPDRECELDYLHAVLRSLPSGHYLTGNDLVRELLLDRLSGAILPWPEERLRRAWSALFVSLDTLAEACRSLPAPQDTESFAAVAKVSDAFCAHLVSCVRHTEMLQHDFKGQANPLRHATVWPAGTATGKSTGKHAHQSTGKHVHQSTGKPAHQSTGKPARQPHAAKGDSSGAVLSIIEGILSLHMNESTALVDVVAVTENLVHPASVPPSEACVCMPSSNPGIWTKSAPDPTDPRWVWGPPPSNKANYAWIMQTLSLLSARGLGILLLSNSPLVSSEGVEMDLRARFAQSGVLQCVISLPGGLFADKRPPASIIVLEKGRPAVSSVLFIDTQDRGETLEVRDGHATRLLPAREVERVLNTYSSWCAENASVKAHGVNVADDTGTGVNAASGAGVRDVDMPGVYPSPVVCPPTGLPTLDCSSSGYCDIPGYCASIDPGIFRSQGYLLAPWAYV
ncbi:MAG: SAM-dependent methyltransferase [Coriobacteriales bacterium]|jgi:hypothetical protein|nr:SAM-dependent methyltransferase [Coriobacteriales bacterium]